MGTPQARLTLFRIIGGRPGMAFCGLCALWAAVVIGLGAYNWHTSRRSEGWPTTSGEIVRAEVEEHITVHRDKDGRAERTTVSHDSKVVYTYRVGGVEHRGERVSFDWELARAQAEATVAKYPKGTFVTVYYDPENPTNAVLEPGGSAFVYQVMIGMGVFVAGMAVVFVLVRGLVLYCFPDWRIEVDRDMARKVTEAKGWRAKWAVANWLQRTAIVIVMPLLAAMLIGWLAGGGVLLYRGVDGYLHPDTAQRWPEADGSVIVSELKPVRVKKSDDQGRGGTFQRFDIAVAIEYRVLGAHYVLNEHFSIEEDEAAARETLARFPKGGYVTIYYNPGQPSEAQLEPPEPLGLLAAALGALMILPWLAAGVMLLGVWVKKRYGTPGGRAGPHDPLHPAAMTAVSAPRKRRYRQAKKAG